MLGDFSGSAAPICFGLGSVGSPGPLWAHHCRLPTCRYAAWHLPPARSKATPDAPTVSSVSALDPLTTPECADGQLYNAAGCKDLTVLVEQPKKHGKSGASALHCPALHCPALQKVRVCTLPAALEALSKQHQQRRAPRGTLLHTHTPPPPSAPTLPPACYNLCLLAPASHTLPGPEWTTSQHSPAARCRRHHLQSGMQARKMSSLLPSTADDYDGPLLRAANG